MGLNYRSIYILSYYFNISIMVDYQTYGSWAIGIAILIFIFWILSKISRHRAEFGTGLERRVEKQTGLGGIRKKIRQIQAGTIAEKQKGKVEEAKEEAEEKGAKGRGADKAEIEAEKGAAKGAKAAEEIEESAEALSAIEGRSLGLIAGLKLIEQAIESYVQRESQEESKEGEELKYINGLIGRIGQMVNYNKIDSHVIAYLENYVNNLLSYLRAEVGTEEGKEKDMKELIIQLKEAIVEMRQVLNEAKTEAGIFRKFERKARNDYSKEIKDLARSLKAKEKELKQAKRAGKGADRNLIANLEREIALMRKQHDAANRLNSQLKSTFKMMDKEIKETRKMIRRLLKLDKNMNRTDKTINKTESKIEKKFKQMRESFEKLEKAIGTFESSKNIHLIALSISKELNDFLKKNKDLGLMTSQFDKSLRNIVTVGFEMSRLTEAYEKMIRGLTDSEKAVDQGMEVLTKVMQSVTSDSEIQIDEKEVADTLEQLKQLLDYEEKIEKYLSNLVTAIEYKLRELFGLIDRLVEEDMRIVNSIEASSGNLGKMMAGAVDRKIAVDEKYMNQAEQFESQLNSRNAAAARAYSQARRAEFRT